MEENKKIKQLINKILSGKSTPEEEIYVHDYFYKNGQYEKWDSTVMGQKEDVNQRLKVIVNKNLIRSKKSQSKIYRILPHIKIAAAILVIFLGAWYWTNNLKAKFDSSIVRHEVIRPGSTKGLLTLTNGEKIDVEGIEVGGKAQRHGITLKRNDNNELVYNYFGGSESWGRLELTSRLNVLKTPLGGQLAIILDDGTKVWLNSGSELHFPNKFNSLTREVMIKGEAYFQVAKNANKPFIVNTNGSLIKVLGTEFNVKSYDTDAKHEVTLVEGSIQLQNENHQQLLRPGQKSILNQITKKMQTVDADLESVTAWKYDNFVFKNKNIKEIMNDISRWYDVEVEYKGNMDDKYFDVYISKKKEIQEVLSIIELTESVKFKIEGRRVKVIE